MEPWNDWYHITGNTYGAWLPGDRRGWLTRQHRVHVELPVPTPDHTAETGLHVQSRHLMTRRPVTLSPAAGRSALDAMLEAFRHHHIELAALSVDDHHFHTLARVPDHLPRKWAGIAKKESARALSSAGLVAPGGVWAVRTHCKPITDRAHQVEVARYIADHRARGAAVWLAWADGRPPGPTR
jgi:hypothetical protein